MGIGSAFGSQEDIWLYDLARNVRSRFTLSQDGRYPVWSPDGSRIAYASARPSQFDLFVKASNGTGQEQLLLDVPGVKDPMVLVGGRPLHRLRGTRSGACTRQV